MRSSRQSRVRRATLVILRLLLLSLATIGTAGTVPVEVAAGIAQAGWSVPTRWERSTVGMERMPWVSGNTLYLLFGVFDIYSSTYNEALDAWSEPKPVPGPINTSANEVNPVVVKGGRVLYFARNNPLSNYDFYRSEWNEAKGEWGTPLKVEAWSTTDLEWDLWVNEDETVAYFTSRGSFGGQKGLGDLDVWKSMKVNGKWSTPVNLGAPINTSGPEWSVFVGPDGKIYTDSYREGTVGKMDIFVATGEKSAPVSWGEPFNSPGDEREIAFNDRWLFITAVGRAGGAGGFDLFVSRWEGAPVVPAAAQSANRAADRAADRAAEQAAEQAAVQVANEPAQEAELREHREAKLQQQPEAAVKTAQAPGTESPPAPGVLALTVPAGTAVLIDGKQVGTGSLEVQLEPGLHKLRLELVGFAPHEEGLAITSSQRLQRTIELSPLVPAGRGFLYLRSATEPVTGHLVSIDSSGVHLVTGRGLEVFPTESLALFTPVEAPRLSGNIPAGVTITRSGELISGLPVAYDAANGVLSAPDGGRVPIGDVAAIVWQGRRLPIANRSPVVTLFEVPQEVLAGRTATFRAEAQDPEGDELTYVWSFSQGKPETAAGQSVTWTAPFSQVGLQVDVTLRVADPHHELVLSSLVNVLPPDADRDGLSDAAERHLRTKLNNQDSDEDRVTDGDEVALGTDPLDVDTDDDGVMDGVEVEPG